MAQKSRKKRNANAGDLATNRRARFDYHLLETYECGLQLTGTEVKSLREGGASFADAYVHVLRGEALLESFHIRHYSHASPGANHPPVRTRKLLLHRRQIEKLVAASQQKGYTIVPVRVVAQGRWLKLEIALARGKKTHDKREDEKERVVNREMRRALKGEHE